MKLNKKANVTMFMIFIIMALTIITISAVIAPFGVLVNTELYEAGEELLLDSQDNINDIENETIKAELNNVLQGALDNTENNIAIGSALFKYGWVALIGLVGFVIFLFTRQNVENGSGLV